jgi:D-alanine-D-alanine ligase
MMSRTKKMNIAVLMGGSSEEREVSLVSGQGVLGALRRRGHDVCPVDPAIPASEQSDSCRAVIGDAPPEAIAPLPAREVFEWLKLPRILEAEIVFIALHGGAGEDGTVQALLETAGKAYTGTGVLGSALAMNKDRSKALFNEAGVQTAPHALTSAIGDVELHRVLDTIEAGIGFPVVIKPNGQGSSVGFSFVENADGLPAALDEAAKYGEEQLVERYVPGREVTVAVLEGEALPIVEIIPQGGFYDYKRKYTKGTSRYEVPARLNKRVGDRIKREALLAWNALGCRDYARVDFRLSEEGEPYCLEVNTLPGMTELSLVPMAADAAGLAFGELIERICLMARERAR